MARDNFNISIPFGFGDEGEDRGEQESGSKPIEQSFDFTLVARGTGPFREKYRPQKIDELVPTCSIELLRNQIDNPGASQIYILEGPTGVGKTTCARVLARAANCLAANSFQKPCLECRNCQTYDDSYDKIELNAANQNKVEDIRSLVEDMRYAPAVYSKKVYILDEVQRLTDAAQQVLLTELEEPFPYLLVFLCTTNISEINKALVDRSCRISFGPLQGYHAGQIVKQVFKHEKIKCEDETIIEQIFTKSQGSIRALLNNIQAYAENGFSPDLWLSEEGSADVKALFNHIIKADWSALSKMLKENAVRKSTEELRSGLENYIRGVLLRANSLEEAVKLGQALEAMQGSLLTMSAPAQYNGFILKCLKACYSFRK